jgi:hypothetical protein
MTMTSPADTLDVSVAFGTAALTTAVDGSTRLVVPSDSQRPQGQLHCYVTRADVVRDALLTMGDVLVSDQRRKATDRADYLAYLISKGKGVSKAVWDAQKEYLALQYSTSTKMEEPLDPVMTVSNDAVRIELMSRDESTYAQLVLRRPQSLPETVSSTLGTTFVDLAGSIAAIKRVRSYRPTSIEFTSMVQPDVAAHAAQTRRVPLRWLRAFGQTQAATTLAVDKFELRPIDLYNVLLTLRMKKARTAPRGLRYELIPGEPPRLVIEPWDLVIHSTGGPYRGNTPRVIRTWGRNRLNVLARVLPHAKSLHVAVAGPGLPATYTVDLGDATLALVLSGWTDANWSGVSTFDLLAGSQQDDGKNIAAVNSALHVATRPMTDQELATEVGQSLPVVRQSIVAGLAQLTIGRDLGTGQLFARPLLATPLAADALRFRDAREAAAHRFLDEPDAVAVTKLHDQGVDGRTIEGRIVDGKAHRTFSPSFSIDQEGRTSSATCTCSGFRRSGIKEGPCEHLIALRVAFNRAQAKLEADRLTPQGRAQITAETRVLIRRTTAGPDQIRLTLDGKRVVTRKGSPGIATSARMQSLRFDSTMEARAAYFGRLQDLAKKGYLDATQD